MQSMLHFSRYEGGRLDEKGSCTADMFLALLGGDIFTSESSCLVYVGIQNLGTFLTRTWDFQVPLQVLILRRAYEGAYRVKHVEDVFRFFYADGSVEEMRIQDMAATKITLTTLVPALT